MALLLTAQNQGISSKRSCGVAPSVVRGRNRSSKSLRSIGFSGLSLVAQLAAAVPNLNQSPNGAQPASLNPDFVSELQSAVTKRSSPKKNGDRINLRSYIPIDGASEKRAELSCNDNESRRQIRPEFDRKTSSDTQIFKASPFESINESAGNKSPQKGLKASIQRGYNTIKQATRKIIDSARKALVSARKRITRKRDSPAEQEVPTEYEAPASTEAEQPKRVGDKHLDEEEEKNLAARVFDRFLQLVLSKNQTEVTRL